jgi:hypothetical protein
MDRPKSTAKEICHRREGYKIEFPIKIPDVILKSSKRQIYKKCEVLGVQIPAGFTTDGATVPRIFWVIIPPYRKIYPAALVHDFRYHFRNHPQGRSGADKELMHNCKDLGLSHNRHLIVWLAVMLFGWFIYYRYDVRLKLVSRKIRAILKRCLRIFLSETPVQP